MKLILVLALLGALVRPGPAQDGDAPLLDPEEVLAAVDARLYDPGGEGLEGFRFRMSMGQATGVFQEGLAGVFMEVSHQAPKSWRMRLVDAKGDALKEIPELFETREGREIRRAWESNLKGVAQHFLVGIGWKERYRDHYKQMKRYLVNDKVEYRLTMNPKKKADASTVILKIVSGLPREIVQIDARGGRYIARYIFEKRDDLKGRHLLVGTKHEVDNVQVMEESYEYLTRKGLVLLCKMTRLVSEGELREQRFDLEELEVNPEFPADWFAAPESRPAAEAEPAEDENR